MTFYHLLFPDRATYYKWYGSDRAAQDEINRDVNIAAVCDEIKKHSPDFPECYLLYPCRDPATALMRAEVMAELLADPAACLALDGFTTRLLSLEKARASAFEAKHPEQKARCFLAAASAWCRCVLSLCETCGRLGSEAMAALGRRMEEIAVSDDFRKMRAECSELEGRVEGLQRMSLAFDYIHGAARVEPPVSGGCCERIAALCRELFDININAEFSVVNSNPITALEESLVEVMKLRDPGLFREVAAFSEEYGRLDFFELTDLGQQLRFYLGYIDFVRRREGLGFTFAMPEFTESELSASGMYDLSLAIKLGSADRVVSNDISLESGGLFVLSGPNQGGKTTFVRSLALNIILSASGCPAAASSFRTPVYDLLLTHFNRPETPAEGGRLAEEFGRIKQILPLLSRRSFVIFNECFASTRRTDGVSLSLKLLDRLFAVGCTGGLVTHYYELSEHDGRVVSLVAGVGSDGERDDVRTYKITAGPPRGSAYARSIAVRCGVTYDQLLEVLEKHEKS